MELVVSTQTVLTDKQLKDIFPSLEKIIEDRKDIHHNDSGIKTVDSTSLHGLLCGSVKSLFTTLASILTAKKSYSKDTEDLFNNLKGCILPSAAYKNSNTNTNSQGGVAGVLPVGQTSDNTASVGLGGETVDLDDVSFRLKDTPEDVTTLTPEDVSLIEDIVQNLLQLNILYNGSTTDDIIRYIIRRYIQQKLTNNGIQVKTNNREGLFNRIFSSGKKLYVLFDSKGQTIAYGAEFYRDIHLKHISSDLVSFYCMGDDTTQKYTILEFDPKRFKDSVAFTNTVHSGIGRRRTDNSVKVDGVFLYISGEGVDNIDKAIQVLGICADEQLGGFSLGEYSYPGEVSFRKQLDLHPNYQQRFGGKKRSSKKTTKRRCGNSKARYYRRCSPMKHPKKTIRQQRRRFSVRRKKT